MDNPALDLARFQFAFTVSFHIVFPALSIGLASFLAFVEWRWLRTGKEIYLVTFRYWLKIFAVTFAMGVVSGIVMSYQFGTNWSVFSDRVGAVLGPLLGYEVLSAFFLEAGFLGIMLFGMQRVGPRLHFFATLMVAAGTLGSAFWILAANSWMHTPAGHTINEAGQFVPADWWQVIFNPSFPYRLVHMVLAAYLTTALVVAAVGAWHVLRDRGNAEARLMLRLGLGMAAVLAPLQIVAGDYHGLNTLEHQPAKIAAMEAHFETQRGAPFILFGWPDTDAGEVRYALQIPRLGSLILTHDWDGEIQGLDAWPRDEWPEVGIVFFTFRLMVALGLLMLVVGVTGAILAWRRRLYESRRYLRLLVAMGPAGFVAIIAGWITTEAGRQPWTVYGLLRTGDSVSPVSTSMVLGSLTAFVIVYLVVFGAGVIYLLRLMARIPGTEDGAPVDPIRTAGTVPGVTGGH